MCEGLYACVRECSGYVSERVGVGRSEQTVCAHVCVREGVYARVCLGKGECVSMWMCGCVWW